MATRGLLRRTAVSAQIQEEDGNADEIVDVFELGDGGMDVEALMAALSGGSNSGDPDLDALLNGLEEKEAECPHMLLLEEDDWRHPPQPLPLSVSVAECVARVNEEGVARVRAMSASTAAALRTSILEELEAARISEPGAGCARDGGSARCFSAVLAPSAGEVETRWDLRLALSPPVRAALRELFAGDGAALGMAMEDLVGAEAELWEMAALVSAPGATAQPVHSDTIFSHEPCLFTAFVALQDVAPSLGPTRFVMRSHTAASHTPRSPEDETAWIAASESSVALLEGEPRSPP